jgi:hypothetical protein
MQNSQLNVKPSSGGGIEEFLRAEGADRLAHGSRSTLYQHLVNTREILRAWAQPAWLCDAGAIHSIYSTETYRRQLAPFSARERMREMAGERVERLAWLFSVVSRADLLRKTDLFISAPVDGIVVELHGAELHAGQSVPVSREEIFALLVLRMANEAEQTQEADGQPGLWLARVSGWARRLPDGPGPIPPVFDFCREIVDPPAERAAREFWLLGLESVANDPEAAGSHFAAASRHCPWIAEPWAGAACAAAAKGDGDTSRRLGAQAGDLFRQWGTAWDKRAPFGDWLDAAEALARGDSIPIPLPAPAARTKERAAAARGSADPAARRLEEYLGLFAMNHRHPRMALYPGLPSRPWYEAADFAIARALEENFGQIRDEALNLERAAFHREIEGIRRDGSWDVFFLYERGLKMNENCALCPVTARIVEEQPAMRTLNGLIYFSRMSPGTHIQPHRGTTNMRVRCHLGLRIPAGDCALRVGTETRQWQQGRAIVFDDNYEHEVWNRTGEDRIVLIVDLWHPDLTPPEIAVIEGIERYAFHHARSLSAYWSGNAEARAAALRHLA